MGRKIDLVTMEMLPGHGVPVAGGGIRTWSLAENLRNAGHEVRICIPDTVATKYQLDQYPTFPIENLQSFIDQSNAEVFLFEQWYPLSLTQSIDRPVVVDLPGPLVLENYWRSVAKSEEMLLAKLKTLSRADLLLYATPRQRYYYMAFLALSGKNLDNPRLLHTPIALPQLEVSSPPQKDPFRFVHAGIFWPWQNPTLPLRLLAECMKARGSGKLDIFGGQHPQHSVDGQQYLELEKQFSPDLPINYRGMLPFEQLCMELRSAGVAIDVVPTNAERELSSTIRTVVYLHCGLPIVLSKHNYLAPLVEEYDAGWLVQPDDEDSLKQVFEGILDSPNHVLDKGRNAEKLAQEHLTGPDTCASLSVALDTLQASPPSVSYTSRMRTQLEEQIKKIGDQEAYIVDRENHIKHLLEVIGDRDSTIDDLHFSLDVQRRHRQALEKSYTIAARDLELIRSSTLYRFIQKAKKMLGKGAPPQDHRPMVPAPEQVGKKNEQRQDDCDD
jgi:glycosyltransferase involved in cell wall biosynthesis